MEDTANSALESLPKELLDSIIQLLDPIALIAISHTSSLLRSVIRPQRRHFVERLLALECLPQFNESANVDDESWHSRPFWVTERQSSLRFACPGCMRLRPQIFFTLHQIVGLGLAKPLPDSPEAEKYLLTSWRPSLRGQHWGRKHWLEKKRSGALAEEKKLGEQLCLVERELFAESYVNIEELMERFENLQDIHIQEFLDLTFADFHAMAHDGRRRLASRVATRLKFQQCQYTRHLRRCIECMHQNGGLQSRRVLSYGTTKVPIVQLQHTSLSALIIERWFPRVLHNLGPGPLESLNASGGIRWHPYHGRGPWPYATPIFGIRCPGCATWQEMRAFRIFPAGSETWRRSWRDIEDRVFFPPGSSRTDIKFYHWNAGNIQRAEVDEGHYPQHVQRVDVDDMCCNACFAKTYGREALGTELGAWLIYLISIELDDRQRAIQDKISDETWTEEVMKIKPDDADPMKLNWYRDFEREEIRQLLPRIEARRRVELTNRWSSIFPEERVRTTLEDYSRGLVENSRAWFWLRDCIDDVGRDGVQGPNGTLVQWALSRTTLSQY